MPNPDNELLDMLIECERWLVNHPTGEGQRSGYTKLRAKLRRTIARVNRLTESAK